MFGYLLRRVLAVVPVLAFVAIFVFLLLRLTPGDPAEILAGDSATVEQIAAIREAMGLNDPLHIQFLTWAGQMLRGDMGTSLISRTPVTGMILDRFGPTLSIAALTIALTVLIAVPMGVVAAWWHRRWVDYMVMAVSVIGFSIPVFVIAYLLILTFSIKLGWFPVQGFTPISEGVGPFLHRAFLPVLTLTAIYVALIARMTRANMLEVLGEDYIRTARAKGAPDPQSSADGPPGASARSRRQSLTNAQGKMAHLESLQLPSEGWHRCDAQGTEHLGWCACRSHGHQSQRYLSGRAQRA